MDKTIKDFHLHNITPVTVRPPQKLIGLSDSFFFIGSCFSEYLYKYLRSHFFPCMTSPFGNTYNPLSVAKTFSMLIDNKQVNEDEVFKHNELFRHFSFHTKVCKQDKNEFITTVNRLINEAAMFLEKTTLLVITFGTAFAYFHRKSNRVVNNCHTLPDSEFERRILSVDEIIKWLRDRELL